MQEFFVNYGLWLLIGLLLLIGVVFLLSGRKPNGALPSEVAVPLEPAAPPPVQAAPPPSPAAEPPVTNLVEPVPAPEPAPTPATAIASDPVPHAPAPVEALPVEALPTEAVPIAAEPPAALTPASGTDDLRLLKGVGPKLHALLIDLGVTSFAQIAGWTDTDIAAIDARLGAFRGRPVRDQWIDQARFLAAGDIAGFEARYGKV